MTYSALPDRRMPYDNDGTVVYQGTLDTGATTVASGATMAEWNDNDTIDAGYTYTAAVPLVTWWFFPEQREVTAFFVLIGNGETTLTVMGSNDTTNGLDGTWETASLGSGIPVYANQFSWRSGIKPISFTGGQRTIRIRHAESYPHWQFYVKIAHLYGEKVAGQTPNDIIYIDHDTTPGVEYTAPEDFGDRPLGTSVVRRFRVKNTSPTLTANTINIQCNDTDFVISTDGTTWVVTINIASLAPGAESATMYVRNTTPAAGSPLGPRFARIVAIVTSWT